ncbi:MAG: hypothetical protein ACREBC_16670 [Pyrinomonadaceae bacterium]
MQRPADFFVNEDRSDHQGYTIKRRFRKTLLEYGVETGVRNHWIDVQYVTVEKTGKRLKIFDANLYLSLGGNTVDFGYFPFLDDQSQQLFVSQDIFRGGCQWVVSLSPVVRVIFDGQELGVGREASDLGAIDLDRDGVHEITAPITDFYQLHDKMSMSQIPLPTIVFKYHPTKQRYLPANSSFRDYVFEGIVEVPSASKDLADQFNHRSVALNNLLIHIYAGDEGNGWKTFNRAYQLGDKSELQLRIKSILRNQRVYNFIYNSGRKK